MVGQIHSNTPSPILGTTSNYYGYYWFGDLPPNIEVVKDIHHDFFLKVSAFFDDTPLVDNPYRSFVFNNYARKSFGGTGVTRSYISSYDDLINLAEDYDLVRQMSHEMVYNFLGPPPHSTHPNLDVLYEGIKNTLSIYFPFRNKFRSGDYFSSTLSQLCMKYYANPPVNLPQEQVQKSLKDSANEYAKELLAACFWCWNIFHSSYLATYCWPMSVTRHQVTTLHFLASENWCLLTVRYVYYGELGHT
jgi:hypothetical protein